MIGGSARFSLVGIATVGAIGLGLCRPATAAPTQPPTTRTSSAATQPGNPAASSRPDAQVLELIADLTSESYDTRQSATRKLMEMGEAVEPQLREALKGELSDEARARVTAALRGIQDHRDFGPSVITMHFKNAPLATVLDDFSRQAGADLGGLVEAELVDLCGVKGARGRRLEGGGVEGRTFWQPPHSGIVASGRA